MAKLDDFMPASHPLSPIRAWLKNVFKRTSAVFSRAYECDDKGGRPSIAPDKLTRALLLRVLNSMRSERTLKEQIFYKMLLRSFVGMAMDRAESQARVFRKSRGTRAMLCHVGHVVTETQGTQANGTPERDAAADMPFTEGADKNYDTAGSLATCRAKQVTTHVAQNDRRGSTNDARTTRWPGFAVGQSKRKCIEQIFGLAKTVG